MGQRAYRVCILQCISAHAPHSGRPQAEIDSWWADFAALLRSHAYENAPLVLGADLDARLGSVLSRAVGDAQPSLENAAAKACHAAFLDLGLWLPATFQEFAPADGSTWFGGATPARLDYVALNAHASLQPLAAHTHPEIDPGTLKPDHVAVSLDVSLAPTSARALPRRRGWMGLRQAGPC